MAEEGAGPWPRASAIALGVMVLAQLCAGAYLNTGYSPTPEGARDSIDAARQGGFQPLVQNFHYWGSAWLIVHSFLHVMLLLWTGIYLRISKWAWVGGLLLFCSALALQITGNLLPFDRHDASTALIEGMIAQRTPIVGDFARSTILGGYEFGPQTLSRWHSAHLWLLAPLVLGALLSLGIKGAATKKIGLRVLWLVSIIAVLTLSISARAPYGPAASLKALEASAGPSWYVLPLHGGLRYFERLDPQLGWIGTVLLPGLFGLLLLLAPWIGRKGDVAVRMLGAGFVVVFALVSLPVMDAVAPPWGLQDATWSRPADLFGGPADLKIDEEKVRAGLELAKQNCSPCHGKDLKGAFGTPNLMTAHERMGSKAENYVLFLKYPSRFRKSTTMPSFAHLGDAKLAQIAEFLRDPKKRGMNSADRGAE